MLSLVSSLNNARLRIFSCIWIGTTTISSPFSTAVSLCLLLFAGLWLIYYLQTATQYTHSFYNGTVTFVEANTGFDLQQYPSSLYDTHKAISIDYCVYCSSPLVSLEFSALLDISSSEAKERRRRDTVPSRPPRSPPRVD